jgi:hypothetical protein
MGSVANSGNGLPTPEGPFLGCHLEQIDDEGRLRLHIPTTDPATCLFLIIVWRAARSSIL